MRLLRTAAGGFLNVEKIVRLIDERGDAADSGVAICENGEEAAPARYYSAPDRVERELPDLVLAASAAGPQRRYISAALPRSAAVVKARKSAI
jgi:hypothetical protein